MIFLKKKALAPLLVVALIGVLVLVFSGGMDLGSLAGFQSVYKANYGHIECVQNYDYDVVFTRFLSDENVFDCDDYTNECKIEISDTSTFVSPSGAYRICDAPSGLISLTSSRSNCGSKIGYSSPTSFVIPVGKSVVFDTGFLVVGEKNTKIIKKAKSFYIRGVENGQVFVQESCVLNSYLRGRVTADGLPELSRVGSNSRQNYVVDFVKVATSVYSHLGKDVICQARQIYAVDEVVFLSGSTKKIQGDMIKSVECCPSEATCTENFEWAVAESQLQIRDCDYSSQCPNGGNPVAMDSTHYVTYSCSAEGICVQSSPVVTECTNTAECILKHGAGSVCDLSPSNWGNCIISTTPNYCGNDVCDSLEGENGVTCPDDCLEQEGTADYSWLLWLVLIGVGVLIFFKARKLLIPYVVVVLIYLVYSSVKSIPLIGGLLP
jgi:hypothetical protein